MNDLELADSSAVESSAGSSMAVAHDKIVIGLVGQVCAGKSSVAAAFRKLGAHVYNADATVHELYTRQDVKDEVRALFGDSVIDADGNVNCKAVGAIVFSDKEKLKVLTRNIIYPRTEVVIEKAIRDFKASDASALLLDAPTLFEAGRESYCDNIVYVSAPKERREEWARKRGWAPGELERREAKLTNDEMKRKRADALIDNSGTIEDLDRQVGRLMHLWSMK